MAETSNPKNHPTIFNEIIRKKVSNYIEGELKEHIAAKVDSIITEVMSNLQTDCGMYNDLLKHEMNLVIKAIYNGEQIKQKESNQ